MASENANRRGALQRLMPGAPIVERGDKVRIHTILEQRCRFRTLPSIARIVARDAVRHTVHASQQSSMGPDGAGRMLQLAGDRHCRRTTPECGERDTARFERRNSIVAGASHRVRQCVEFLPSMHRREEHSAVPRPLGEFASLDVRDASAAMRRPPNAAACTESP